jgi:hypothetical protein
MQMAQIGPTETEFASFVSILSDELQRYHDPKYKPNLLFLRRNTLLLRECPNSTDRSTTTRARKTASHNTIREMHEKLDVELYILCTSRIPPTKLASLNALWIMRLQQWWSSVPRITRQREVALELWKDFGLSDHVQQPSTHVDNGFISVTPNSNSRNIRTASEAIQVSPETNTGVPPEHIGNFPKYRWFFRFSSLGIVHFEPSEFIAFLNSTGAQEKQIHDIIPFLRDTENLQDIKMVCPWHGNPSVEVNLKFDVPIRFSERLLRYKYLTDQEAVTYSENRKNQTVGRP